MTYRLFSVDCLSADVLTNSANYLSIIYVGKPDTIGVIVIRWSIKENYFVAEGNVILHVYHI